MSISDWTPTLDAVGSILRARTRDTQGNELGTFNGSTRPTDVQVAELIATAVGDVASAVVVDVIEPLWGSASSVATYRAAMLVELSYFPEQVATGRSPYEQLRELYLDSLKSLVFRANDSTPGEGPGVPSPPSFAFPFTNTLDYVLGPVPGGYVIPYGGGLYQ